MVEGLRTLSEIVFVLIAVFVGLPILVFYISRSFWAGKLDAKNLVERYNEHGDKKKGGKSTSKSERREA